MPPLLRFALLFMLVFTSFAVAAWLIGHTLPPMQLARIMTGPDGSACGQPCLFGVFPGVTGIDDARHILNIHPLTRDSIWIRRSVLQINGPSAYVVLSQTAERLVDSIGLVDDLGDRGIVVPGSLADSYTLGEVVLTLGTSNVGLPGSPYFVVGVPDTGVTAAIARPANFKTRIRPDTRVNLLMLSMVRPCPGEGTMLSVHPWMGFTTFERYTWDRRSDYRLFRASGIPGPPYAACQE